MTIYKTIDVGDEATLILTPADQAALAGLDVYLVNGGETNIYTGPATVSVAGVPILPGALLSINPAVALYAICAVDGTLVVESAPIVAPPGDYTLVGGPYTPQQYVGQPCSAIPTAILLRITQASPPPFIVDVNGTLPADTTDPDVLGVRAYLHTSWGQVRLYQEGNLTIGDIG